MVLFIRGASSHFFARSFNKATTYIAELQQSNLLRNNMSSKKNSIFQSNLLLNKRFPKAVCNLGKPNSFNPFIPLITTSSTYFLCHTVFTVITAFCIVLGYFAVLFFIIICHNVIF